MIEQIFKSILFYFKGWLYTFKNPWIFKYIVLAIFLNILIFLGLASLVFWLATLVSQWLANFVGMNNFWLIGLLGLLLGFWLLSILSNFFVSLSSIANAPVYSALTSEILRREFAELQSTKEGIVKTLFLAFGFECKKLFLSFLFLLLTSLLNLIPFLGSLLFVFCNLLALILVTGLDVFEPYHTYRKLSFRDRIENILRFPFLYFSFLLLCGFTYNLPLLNIVLIPLSIPGAVYLMKETEEQTQSVVISTST